MVRHQAIGVNTAAKRVGQLAKVQQIDLVVAIDQEASTSVIPPLHDMQSDVRQDKTRLTRHSQKNGASLAPLTQIGL